MHGIHIAAGVKGMPMSEYYKQLRDKIGTDLIFSPSVAAIIRNKNGHVLFMLGADNHMWSIPAGAIEIGETPADAVVREVWEETGLRVVPEQLLGVFGGKDFRWTYLDGNQVEYVIFVFECKVQGGTLEAIDGEAADLRYFDPADMPPLQFPYPLEIFYKQTTICTFFQPATAEVRDWT